MDFDKDILENRKNLGRPFLAAHRGVCGANIPCNTIAAFAIAVAQGAEVIELDVAKSKDGELFVFHPGMEHVYLKCGKSLEEMSAAEIENVAILNQDEAPTSYKIPTLEEVLTFLKGKAYIAVDKFWTEPKGISEVIRKVGVEKQVIVKTYTDEESIANVEKYASDFMFLPMVFETDTVTEMLLEKNIRYIGLEALFETEQADIISDEYIESMHKKGLLVWMNGIVYNEKAVISAHHTDDISLTDSPEKGWGWLAAKGADFIQTDWLLAAKNYFITK